MKGPNPPAAKKPRAGNHYLLVVLDSCRYDAMKAAGPKTLRKLGRMEKRWSYASWTAPSHYNLLTGLMPHQSPKRVFASEYYQRDFLKYNERLGVEGLDFRAFLPRMYLPPVLRTMGWTTHAMVSMPVLNPATAINSGFDSYRLMEKHNDLRAMVRRLEFPEGERRFYLLNAGETHYPYALPHEPEGEWPRISGLHGALGHMEGQAVGGKLKRRAFPAKQLRELKQRQIEAVRYLDGVLEEMFDLVPKNTYVTVTSDHGELFGEDGYFGHGPILHDLVLEVPFVEGKIR